MRLVRDHQRRGAAHHVSHRHQRHLGDRIGGGDRAACRLCRAVGAEARHCSRYTQLRQLARIGDPGGQSLHHHAILVALLVDRADLALAEGIVEHILDRLHGDAQAGGAVAVHHDFGGEPILLLVGRDMGEIGAGAQTVDQQRRPVRELGLIGIGEGVLVLGTADSGADLDILHGLEEHREAGNAFKPMLQAGDHHWHGVAQRAGFQRDGEAAHVGRGVDVAGADEGGDVGHRRIGPHDGGGAQLQGGHGGDGDVLRAFRGGDDGAGILLRQEAFWHNDIQGDGAGQREQGDDEHRVAVAQGHDQAAPVALQQAAEEAVAARAAARLDGLEQPAAHHRGQREGDHRRDGDGDRQGDGEFLEQPPHHAAHEQQRDEHGDERDGEGDDREADLAGAAEGGFQRPDPILDIADHVLDHDDRIVHHEAGGHRQRHEREVVQAVAEPGHDAERADQAERQGHGGDEGGAP